MSAHPTSQRPSPGFEIFRDATRSRLPKPANDNEPPEPVDGRADAPGPEEDDGEHQRAPSEGLAPSER